MYVDVISLHRSHITCVCFNYTVGDIGVDVLGLLARCGVMHMCAGIVIGADGCRYNYAIHCHV